MFVAYTDASLHIGFEGYNEMSNQWVYSVWTSLGPDFDVFHINAKEMCIEHLAVRLFYHKILKEKIINIYSDNQVIVNCLIRGYSSSEQMFFTLIIINI